MDAVLMLLAVGLACLLAGIIAGWFLGKSKLLPSLKLLEENKTQAASLQTANQYLQQQVTSLKDQLQSTELKFQQSRIQEAELSTKLHAYAENLNSTKTELGIVKNRFDECRKELIVWSNETNRLKAQLQYRDEQIVSHKQQLEEIGNKFSKEFQLLAQKVLDEKTNSFHSVQEKSIGDLLNPLKENLKTFKEEFETKYKTESDDRISLREQIKHMMLLNQTLSDQANNLTHALRGQVKHQGNWGEMILESILEYSDLKKGIHYFVQEKTIGEDGQTLLPDVIVRYPDGRSIVLDSKVSLLHYEQYCNATDEGAQRISLNLMQQSVIKHIDGLSSKKYPDAVKALDFVMLFVPVEGAYITLMQANPQLWQYAYKKRVLLISPTNLIAAMKLVYDLWKREGINQNAQQVAERAVKIYEKLASFVEDFEKAGAQIDKAQSAFGEAKKKLHTGKGNLISLASQMKQKLHHNKPQKELPALLTEQAENEEDAL
jgi:DNA recombination protein RmuC